MTTPPVIVTIRYQAQPGREEQTRAALGALIATVVASEPDCLGIRLHQNADDVSQILLYEHWQSRESYTGPHMNTPHLRAFMLSARELLAGPPTIEYWSLLDDVAP